MRGLDFVQFDFDYHREIGERDAERTAERHDGVKGGGSFAQLKEGDESSVQYGLKSQSLLSESSFFSK